MEGETNEAVTAAVSSWLDRNLDRILQMVADRLEFERLMAEFEDAGLIRCEGSRVHFTEKGLAFAQELEKEGE